MKGFVDGQNSGPPAPTRDSGVSTTLLRACRVLSCFSDEAVVLNLKQIVERVGLPSTTVHRILSSLTQGNVLVQGANLRYKISPRIGRKSPARIGYAAQTAENSFSRVVTESIRSSALSSGIELVLADNHYSPRRAIRNAARFVEEKVELVIEFQSSERAAPKVTSQLRDAGIPVIAIEIPHPGATYFGADNYRAGSIGGKALSRGCLAKWEGHFDDVLLFKQSAAGHLPQSRLDGTLSALRSHLPDFCESKVRIIDGQGRLEPSLENMRRFLRRSRSKRLLISGVNDLCCLGALQALREAGRERDALIIGQNGTVECRVELRKKNSAFIGSVAYFPEAYGRRVIALARDILSGNHPPPAVFTEHVLLTSKNVDTHYPYDSQTAFRSTGDGLLTTTR